MRCEDVVPEGTHVNRVTDAYAWLTSRYAAIHPLPATKHHGE